MARPSDGEISLTLTIIGDPFVFSDDGRDFEGVCVVIATFPLDEDADE